MEEQEQQGELNTLRGETVGIAGAVALQQAVPLEFSQIVTELVQTVSGVGEVEGGQDGVMDFAGCPAADVTGRRSMIMDALPGTSRIRRRDRSKARPTTTPLTEVPRKDLSLSYG